MNTRELPFLLIVAMLLAALALLAWLGYYRLDRKVGIVQEAADVAPDVEGNIMTIVGPTELIPDGNGDRCGDVNFVVKPRTLGIWQLSLEKDETITGSLRIGGADKEQMRFRILSPSHRRLTPEGERSDELRFSINAPLTGEYTFQFDNQRSPFEERTVSLNVCVR